MDLKISNQPTPPSPQKLPRVMSTTSPCAICCRQYNGICSVVTGWGRLEDRTGTIAPPGCWTHFRPETPRSDPVERNKLGEPRIVHVHVLKNEKVKVRYFWTDNKIKRLWTTSLSLTAVFTKVNMVEQKIPIVIMHH